MTALYKQMGLQVIDEGMETSAKREALTRAGSDLLQAMAVRVAQRESARDSART